MRSSDAGSARGRALRGRAGEFARYHRRAPQLAPALVPQRRGDRPRGRAAPRSSTDRGGAPGLGDGKNEAERDDPHVFKENDYISLVTSLGMSRGIPGYPGGLPRGSAGEAGPVPPRPLPSRGLLPKTRRRTCAGATGVSFPDLHKTGGCCN